MSSGNRQQPEAPRDPVFVGAEAALRRAAKRARLRAEEVARNAATSEPAVPEPDDLKETGINLDARTWKTVLMKRDTVLNELRTHKATLAVLYGVTKLALFGSYARDQATDNSDIDVVVHFDSPATSERYFGVQFYLEDLLGCPVDLVTDKALRAELRPYVEREMVNI